MSSEPGPREKQSQSTIDLTSMTPMEFTVISEPWTKYKLEDQTKLFVKLVVVKVVRGLNEQGQPSYNMNAQNIIATQALRTFEASPRRPSLTWRILHPSRSLQALILTELEMRSGTSIILPMGPF